ncbi:MAG: SulP family inorganic anion transporter [Candidatus Saccharimonadales bacterium]
MNIPQFVSLQGFTRKQVKSDFFAALVVTAIAIPESLGFAAIVGLPLQTGLYCALLAPIVFALITSSKHLVVGADSATAALVASGAATIAAAGTPAYGAAVAVLGILTGLVLLLFAVFKFGFVADLISKPVFIGFLAGIGVQLIVGKIPELVGVEAHGTMLQKMYEVSQHMGSIHFKTLAFSLVLFGIFYVLSKRKLPASLLVLVVATAATYFFKLDQHGIAVIGTVASGLPTLVVPQFHLETMQELILPASAIAIVILAQSSAVIRSSATRFDEQVSDNRDLAALGAANLASSLTGGFAINGSPPRTIAAEMSGGRTQLVNVFMAGLIGLLLVFFSSALQYVPIAALAVIVWTIGLHLFDIDKLRRIFQTRKSEFWVALIALVSVALFGVQYGVLIAVITSIMERLHRQYRPSDEILLRDGELAEWAEDRLDKHHRHRSAPEGVLAYRFNSSLFFENTQYFSQRMLEIVAEAKRPVTTLVLDAGAMNDIDYTGADAIKRLCHKLNADDIRFCMAHVPPQLMQLLERYELRDLIGEDNIYPSLNEAIFDAPSSKRSVVEMVKRLDPPKQSYLVIAGGVMEAIGLRTTNDVDLVVTKSLYEEYRRKGWREYTQDDGKRILSHNGYQIMVTYVGRSLAELKKHSFMHEGVRFMGIEDLIACKKKIGRQKDLADLALLAQYFNE